MKCTQINLNYCRLSLETLFVGPQQRLVYSALMVPHLAPLVVLFAVMVAMILVVLCFVALIEEFLVVSDLLSKH